MNADAQTATDLSADVKPAPVEPPPTPFVRLLFCGTCHKPLGYYEHRTLDGAKLYLTPDNINDTRRIYGISAPCQTCGDVWYWYRKPRYKTNCKHTEIRG